MSSTIAEQVAGIQRGEPQYNGGRVTAAGYEERPFGAPQPNPADHIRREITIRPIDHGYIVTVGCQTFAIESLDKLIRNLDIYLKDLLIEKKWMTKEFTLL